MFGARFSTWSLPAFHKSLNNSVCYQISIKSGSELVFDVRAGFS